MEDLSFIGFTLDAFGKIMVSLTAIMVHHRVLHDHKVDKNVFREMKREQIIGLLGLVFIVTGYFLQIPGKV